MYTYKVEVRIKGKRDTVYVDAVSFEQVKWKVIARFYYAAVLSIVEVARG